MNPKEQKAENQQTREAWLSADSGETIPEKMLDEIEETQDDEEPKQESDPAS